MDSPPPYSGPPVQVIGGGLAGCEAAWQIAERGIPVRLSEMRPRRATPAHRTDRLAELVCSNSLGSKLTDRPTGLLQTELRRLGSLILAAADTAALPAGGALAVDRDGFAEEVTRRIEAHPLLELCREEVTELLPGRLTVVATGPLTSDALAQAIQELTGAEHLFFFDAMAPVVDADSLDRSICFRASRYDRGDTAQGDYLNCPMTRPQYECFVCELRNSETAPLRDFERDDRRFFEACLPVEELARRGERTLAFGPLRPKGLTDPRTGIRPYAVVQLRQDDRAGTLYNLVGFQTNLTYAEQRRVFRLIPGLEHAEFVRYGQMHRNTFFPAPRFLTPALAFRGRPELFFAGQLIGSEGYIGNVATGLVAGINVVRRATGCPPMDLPGTTMTGALLHYLTHADPDGFQPMKANFGLLPPLHPPVKGKRPRCQAYAQRALAALTSVLCSG